MTNQAQRKINVVTTEAMMDSAVYRAMKNVGSAKLQTALDAIKEAAEQRTAFEAQRERIIDGLPQVGQSPDIKHVQALVGNEAFARFVVAQKVDVLNYLHPAHKGQKTGNETSNLKAYAKVRQVAELLWSGTTDLENVVKVFTVCAYRSAVMRGPVIERDFAETFLSSVEFRTIKEGSADLWSAIDEVRAKHMTTGAQTQASQMIRTLVAVGAAEDVRDGRRKNVRVDPTNRVLLGVMRRFGQTIDAEA